MQSKNSTSKIKHYSIAILIAILAGAIFRDATLLIFIFMPIGLAIIVIMLLISILSRKINILILTILILTVFFFSSIFFYRYDIAKTRELCEELISDIEKDKEKNGIYPPAIPHLIKIKWDSSPYFFKISPPIYRSILDEFELKYTIPAGLFPYDYTYNNKTKKWKVFH